MSLILPPAPPSAGNLAKIIAASGTPVSMYGNGAQHTLATVAIPANSIAPDSVLELEVFFTFYLPNNGGRSISVSIGGQVFGQSYPNATNGGLSARNVWYVTSDLGAGKSATNGYTQNNTFGYSVNFNDVLSPTAGQAGIPFGVHASGRFSYAIDWTQAQTVLIQGYPQTGDQMEITGWRLTNSRNGTTPTGSYAPSTSWVAWGDSLTFGVGSGTTVSATTGSYPQQIAFSPRVGIPYVNMGVGGDKSIDILARVLADKIRGKYWNAIFDMGRNDFGAGSPNAAVLANIAAAVGNLAPGVKYVVNTVTNGAGEPPGSGNWNALVSLNTSIKATYGAHVADVFGAFTANGTAQVNNNLRNITVSTTSSGSTASGATTITVASATGIANGMFIDDATGFIPAQTTITISATTVTLSSPTTGVIPTGTALNFVAAGEVHFRDAGYALKATTVKNAMTANGF